MAHAVLFSEFGGPEVLEVVEVDDPRPGPGEVLVEVVATGVNPVESAIRRGDHPERWPVTFPEGQGRDLAGIVRETAPDVTEFAPNDSVCGFVARGSQATLVAVPAHQLIHKPKHIPWEVAGSLYVAGTTAWEAVHAVGLAEGETVVITAAAGGVGCLTAQLAIRQGAQVIGTAAGVRADFLRQLGVRPVSYGDDLVGRVRELAPGGVAAFIDFYGGGQVEEAIRLGVPPRRIVTVTDWDAVEEYGVGRALAGDAVLLARIAHLIEQRQLRLPIADIFSLDRVADAYRALDRREAPGKIVLGMQLVGYKGQRVHEVDMKEQDVTLGVATPHEQMEVTEQLPPVLGDRWNKQPE